MSVKGTFPELAPLVEKLRGRPRFLVFTGAGISTGSGIPDFRGPQGIWKKWTPVYYQEFLSSREARIRHWQYKLEGWEGFRDAKPNAAHRALSRLDRRGRLDTVVTQNIDGLHQLAGHPPGRVIELHGTNRMVECTGCGARQDPDPVYSEFARTGDPPRCSCGGFLKPATVSFGQAMPRDKLASAFEAAARAQVVCSIGSTLEVEPAASVPRAAHQGGAFYAIINRGATAHDRIADLKVEADVNRVLPVLERRLSSRRRGG
ncbi:MAG: Sir2 family NAD-dependent protein deacetylase [Candidatus Aminicenantes bacterium]|nr:Sir2 family NAD-dependent protein deacetylase [Candidatus Aminicenantes bacterium]